MINMDELWEYDTQSNTDMADELNMLEIEHEIRTKEKAEREHKQHVAESNDTDVYVTQETSTDQKQNNTATDTDTTEHSEDIIEKKSDVKSELDKDKAGGGSSSADSNASVVPGVPTGGNVNRKTAFNIGRNSNLFNSVMNKLWYASIKESDKNIVDRVRQIKNALSAFRTEEDLLMHINEYIDDGHIMNEETFFCLTAIYKYDLKFYRNYKKYSIDRNSRYGKALDDFVTNIPKLKQKSKNHS